jgi:hypothetical protein
MSRLSCLRGERFLAALPSEIASPSIATAPDGSLALEWVGQDRRSFSIQIDEDEKVSLAWQWGEESGHSWTRIVDTIPEEVLSRLRKTLM